MAGNLNKAGEARIKKANSTWGQVSRRIFRNKNFNRKIKIILWNSLLRSTMTYGLRAKGLPRHLIEKIEIYMYQHIRMMINPQWKIEE